MDARVRATQGAVAEEPEETDAHGCASVARGHECMDARVRATQGAVAEEPEATAGDRATQGAVAEENSSWKDLGTPLWGENQAKATGSGEKCGLAV